MQDKCSLIRHPSSTLKLKAPVIATVGNFDGVHLGHQKLLSRLVQEKSGGKVGSSVALSFYPHPAVALGFATRIPQITSIRQKLRAMGECSIDLLCLFHFTKAFSTLTATQFIDQILINIVGIDTLILGPDGTIGKGREGTPKLVAEYLSKLGKRVIITEFLDYQGEKVSSRAIRSAIERGDVELARHALGRPFALEGVVIHGDQRGRGLNAPTANILPSSQVTPKFGVYVTSILLGEKLIPSVTNVGVRPSFGGRRVLIETHALTKPDLALYGKRIEVLFHSRIRDEIKFPSGEELKAQISKDIEVANRYHGAK